MRLIADIETNGLLHDVTVIHCLVAKDADTGKVSTFHGGAIEDGIKLLQQADHLIFHNGLDYDLPVIQKLYPWFSFDFKKVTDTLVISRLFFPDLLTRDGGHVKAGRLPAKRVGSHALEAWGMRLGVLKGDYAEEFKAAWVANNPDQKYPDGLEWAEFSTAMLEYCVQDVEVTETLYNHFSALEYSQQAIEIEHEVRQYCSMMTRSGWPFNTQAAVELYSKLAAERDAIRQQMLDTFPPLVIERFSEKTGKRLKDRIVEFNPGSRDQIAQRLIVKYGWEPKAFTEGGKPQIDETILEKLDYPEAKFLSHYFLLEKRIGQLAEGNQAWLKHERKGHIHHSINTNGAVTGRCTHSWPNVAQVPTVRALWGKECRGLWGVRPGFRQVGVDLSGIELRCLAHYMARWDQGAYGEVILNGDIHTVNQEAAGLPTRDNAKTFIYGWLYGAGDAKIGSIVGKGAKEGKKLKESFLRKLPALGSLKKAVDKAAERGFLIGLDGRRVPVRHKHAALNTLLQGAGALIAKQWLIECFHEAERRGFKYGWDRDFTLLGWVHDELQWAVKEGSEEAFGEMVAGCARKAGDYFKFKCPVDAEFKTGASWADCH
ncbi:DNA polymerase I [Caballeronia temeraria]|uniref:DNA polymerase I n=1 Tax=Caballeronia temeraria TaxID=1777137 RepID=A0A158DMD1_9BURK|nr:DNA polymerase [Caballeronia temeraria]SAK95744.1 DNA polymerase I [Caballeronia temeraria]